MMRFKIVTVALLLMGSLAIPAHAAENELDWPPSELPTERLLGMHIQDDFGVGMNNRLSKMVMPGPQPDCSSLDDPKCTSLASVGWWILRVLPPCVDTHVEDDCVEGLEVTQGGVTKKSVLLDRIKNRTWIADSSRGFPEAGSQGIWSDPFSTDSSRGYYVNVFGDLRPPLIGIPRYTLGNFFASITLTSDSPAISGTCIWSKDGKCGHRIPMAADTRLSLTLHLSPYLTGWLGGRLSQPEISVTKINESVNRIVITGEPMNVNVVGARLPYESAPKDLVDFMRSSNPGCPADRCNVGIASSGPHTFNYLEKWKPVTKDTASRTIPYWSISNTTGQHLAYGCGKSGFIGLVTSNATAYQQEMPSLDDSELTYKVAGPHFMPDGKTLSLGTYNLILRSDVARCVYSFTDAPIKASVSITNEGDSQSVATEVVNEKDGWLYLAANGFHYSQPTIKIQLSQEPQLVEPAPEMTTVAAPKAKKKVSITCAKGKAKKKVTGFTPKCPAGYKKVA